MASPDKFIAYINHISDGAVPGNGGDVVMTVDDRPLVTISGPAEAGAPPLVRHVSEFGQRGNPAGFDAEAAAMVNRAARAAPFAVQVFPEDSAGIWSCAVTTHIPETSAEAGELFVDVLDSFIAVENIVSRMASVDNTPAAALVRG